MYSDSTFIRIACQALQNEPSFGLFAGLILAFFAGKGTRAIIRRRRKKIT